MDRNEREIESLINAVAHAVCTATGAALLPLMDDEFREFAPGAPVLRGRSGILLALEQWFISWRPDLRLVCDEIVADTVWGFCSGTFGLRLVHRRNAMTRYNDGKFLAVVRKGGGGEWRLFRLCHNTNLPETD